jgi:hypothetical protein
MNGWPSLGGPWLCKHEESLSLAFLIFDSNLFSCWDDRQVMPLRLNDNGGHVMPMDESFLDNGGYIQYMVP